MPEPDLPSKPLPDDGVTRIEIPDTLNKWNGPITFGCIFANVIVGNILRERPFYTIGSSWDRFLLSAACFILTTLPFILLHQVLLFRRKRTLAVARRWGPEVTLQIAAERLFRRITVREVPRRLRTFASLVDTRGEVGMSVVIRCHKEIPHIHAIDTPFEPRLLEATDEVLTNAASQTSTGSSDDIKVPSLEDSKNVDASDNTRSRFLIRLIGLITVTASVIWVVAHIVATVRHRWVTSLLFPFSALALAIVTAWGLRGLIRRDSWLLAPSAIILRRATGIGARIQLLMFKRHAAVLCMMELPMNYWAVFVRSGSDSAYRTVTTEQLIRLLRAWLSPVSPPVSRLVDFE